MNIYAPWFQGTNIHLLFLFSLALLIIIFDWNGSHDHVYKILKQTTLRRLGHEISYDVICGAPLYIQFPLTDTVSDEKETHVDVIGAHAT